MRHCRPLPMSMSGAPELVPAHPIDWNAVLKVAQADLITVLENSREFTEAQTLRAQCYHACQLLRENHQPVVPFSMSLMRATETTLIGNSTVNTTPVCCMVWGLFPSKRRFTASSWTYDHSACGAIAFRIWRNHSVHLYTSVKRFFLQL
jgi:hypothetical protein